MKAKGVFPKGTGYGKGSVVGEATELYCATTVVSPTGLETEAADPPDV
jgi:hypothetical protein